MLIQAVAISILSILAKQSTLVQIVCVWFGMIIKCHNHLIGFNIISSNIQESFDKLFKIQTHEYVNFVDKPASFHSTLILFEF